MRIIHAELSDWQRDFVRGAIPDIRRIVAATYTRDEWLPAPIKLELEIRDGSLKRVILKSTRLPLPNVNEPRELDTLIGHESAVLGVLEQSDLPVPRVLAGPALNPEGKPAMLISFMEGTDLQTLSCRPGADLEQAKQLVVDAVQEMHRVTDFMERNTQPDLLPRVTLSDELESVAASAGEWAGVPVFTRAVDVLREAFLSPAPPLVFTNGDYQPGNFLVDEDKLVGFLDFEFSRFEDPLYGIVKYRVYDMLPLDKAGMVEFYLDRMGFTPAECHSRMALRCLWTLRREVPVSESVSGEGLRIVRLLESSIAAI